MKVFRKSDSNILNMVEHKLYLRFTYLLSIDDTDKTWEMCAYFDKNSKQYNKLTRRMRKIMEG